MICVFVVMTILWLDLSPLVYTLTPSNPYGVSKVAYALELRRLFLLERERKRESMAAGVAWSLFFFFFFFFFYKILFPSYA